MTDADAVCRGGPDRGPAEPGDACSTPSPPRTARCPSEVVVVDDRPRARRPAARPASGLAVAAARAGRARVGPGTGGRPQPRLARRDDAQWVCFLDDDVVLPAGWAHALAADLDRAQPDGAPAPGRASACRCPTDRRPTDWERSTAGLERRRWATADMAYRRAALARGRRLRRALPPRLPRGRRPRPAGAAGRLAPARRSARGRAPGPAAPRRRERAGPARQRRRRADARACTGRGGASWPGTGRGRLPLARRATVALRAAARRRRSPAAPARPASPLPARCHGPRRRPRFARRRIAPGPRDRAPRWLTMAWTSAAIPLGRRAAPARGWWRAPRRPGRGRRAPRAVLFDRDGTLVHDVPYNGDPDAGRAGPRARRAAVDRLRVGRAAGRGGDATSRGWRAACSPSRRSTPSTPRSTRRSGPFDTWQVCPHAPDDGVPVPQAPTRAWCGPPPADLGVRPARVRRHRRHRRRRRGRPGRRRRGDPGAHAGDPRRGGRGGARGRHRPRAGRRPRPRVAPWRDRRRPARCSPSGSTATATSCSPGRRCGRSARAATGWTCSCRPAAPRPPALLPGVDEVLVARRRRGRGLDAADPSTRRALEALVARLRVRALRRCASSSRPSTRAPCPWRCWPGGPASPRVVATSDDYPGSCWTSGTAALPDGDDTGLGGGHEVGGHVRRSSRRPATPRRSATTAARGCTGARSGPTWPRVRPLRRRAPRAPRCPARGLAVDRAARHARRWPRDGWRGRRHRRARARSERRRARRPPGGRRPHRADHPAPSWPPCSRARPRRRRQHRTRAPGRGRGHPCGQPLLARRAGRALAPVGRAARACSATSGAACRGCRARTAPCPGTRACRGARGEVVAAVERAGRRPAGARVASRWPGGGA